MVLSRWQGRQGVRGTGEKEGAEGTVTLTRARGIRGGGGSVWYW